MTQRQERQAEDDTQQLTPTLENHTPGLGQQMHNSNEVTPRCPQSHASPTSKYQFSARHEKQYHAFECELAVKLHAKDVNAETSANGKPRQDQATMRGFTVLDLLTPKSLLSLGFSIMHNS